MYYNVFGEKVSRRRYREMGEAAKTGRELMVAGLSSRRDLFRMGLLTAGGMLVAKSGLSARAQNIFQSPGAGGNPVNTNNPPSSGKTTSPGTNQNCVPSNQPASPHTNPFVTPLPILPLAATTALSTFSPQPTDPPNPPTQTDATHHPPSPTP